MKPSMIRARGQWTDAQLKSHGIAQDDEWIHMPIDIPRMVATPPPLPPRPCKSWKCSYIPCCVFKLFNDRCLLWGSSWGSASW